ncbi:glycoside hydrolase domain-containing protein [Glycomyces sp. NRRL B-16210]|uniref:glycoside hydrolase domain-containing protein n=1 Tax=Glycomyces sp. NRRL B-16210 TaxID=1463821 RepID=UPI00068FD183|nr:glycoside hydrolase domain-containing protein [Glycomyces sp. NRRL B-16210]
MRRETGPPVGVLQRLSIGLALAGLISFAFVADGSRPAAAEPPPRDYVDLVNPWVESDLSRFFFFQSASQPFGFVKLRPDTSTHHPRGTGYHWSENDVKGFSHIHDWQISGVQVMPTTGTDVPKLEGDTGWQSHVDHTDGEIAQPGYHRLELDRYGITAELTATERVGLHRYTYDEAGPSEIIVNLAGQLGEAVMENAHVTKVGDSGIEGYVVQHGDRSIHPSTKLYFTVDFDRPFDSLHGWSEGSLVDGGAAVEEVSGEDMGVYVRYDDLAEGEQIQMKVGLSLTGVDGARRNVQAELPGWDFDATKAASQQVWNEMLGRIDVQGGSERQQVKFYTDLFHVLCGRSAVSDADGKYLDATWGAERIGQIPLDDQGRPEFAMYNYDALWLTQWNLNTVLGLAYPEVYSSLVRSQLQMYEDGGLLPRGPVAGDDSLIMTGAPVTSFIAGAYNKGIRDFDVDLAFEAMLDAQSLGGLFDKGSQAYGTWGNGGAREYLDLGYAPNAAGQTLEYAYQDWTLAQLAGELDATGVNAAQFAEVTVSSQLDDTASAGERAVDGRPSRAPGATDWRSAGETDPWIQLSWDEPRTIDKVVLSDRASADSNAGRGMLVFSDGTRRPVARIPADGGERVIEFRPKEVEWVRFEVTGGSGTDVGLNEFEVWDDTDVHDYLMERSGNWRNVFDHDTGFSRPRDADGKWKDPFDPLSMSGFVQASSWQSTWFTVHDVMGLANELGGTQAYADKLNYAFEQAEDENFIAEYDGGYVSYGNQPGLEMAHLFNYVGKPWLTQYWMRQVNEKTYGSIATDDGYGHHDEDQGQMGAMSALMSMGLFEVTGGGHSSPVYDLTSPVFDEITIELHPDYYEGDRFRIVTHGNSDEAMYIQRAELDGEAWDASWFRHEQLTDGGTLELWMGEQPNEDWGVDVLPPSESEPAVAAATFVDDSPRVDPGGAATAALRFENRGDEPLAIEWNAPGLDALQVTPDSGTVEVAPGETADAEVTIQAAEDAEGTHRLAIDARTTQGTALSDAIAYVQVAPAVSLASAPDAFTLLEDTPANIRVTLGNNDTDRANSTEVGLGVPDGWVVEPEARQIELGAGETFGVDFTVTPPIGASGTEQLDLSVDWDGGGLAHAIEATVGAEVALVGAIDTNAAEFALAPRSYGDYPDRFSEGVDFTVGEDDPAADWSYIHPGPNDSWASGASSDFTLRFTLDEVPAEGLTLTAWLLDTHQSAPPSIAIALNGHDPTTVETARGGGDGYRWESGSSAADGIRPSQFEVVLPADQLTAGENTVTLANTGGSWLVYDAIGIRE